MEFGRARESGASIRRFGLATGHGGFWVMGDGFCAWWAEARVRRVRVDDDNGWRMTGSMGNDRKRNGDGRGWDDRMG